MERPSKGWLAAGTLLLIVIGFATTVVAGHQAATMEGDLEVTDTSCTNGNVTAVTMRVSVNESRTVHPHVWSQRGHVQHTWEPENITLQAGTQFVQITAPRDRVTVRGDRGQVALYDGQRRLIDNWEVDQCE
jgi:hypothetical protein